MDGADDRVLLEGEWVSCEAFGNTALDWSQAVKDGAATAELKFASDNSYSLHLYRAASETPGGEREDMTSSFRHVVASEGAFEVLDGNALAISGASSPVSMRCSSCGLDTDNDVAVDDAGDTSGIRWSFQLEEDDELRIRWAQGYRNASCN